MQLEKNVQKQEKALGSRKSAAIDECTVDANTTHYRTRENSIINSLASLTIDLWCNKATNVPLASWQLVSRCAVQFTHFPA